MAPGDMRSIYSLVKRPSGPCPRVSHAPLFHYGEDGNCDDNRNTVADDNVDDDDDDGDDGNADDIDVPLPGKKTIWSMSTSVTCAGPTLQAARGCRPSWKKFGIRLGDDRSASKI